MSNNKQYGLIIPNKSKLTPANEVKRASIFEEDSDDDSEQDDKPTGITKNLKRQDRIAIQKAVEEDPTIYQYDELYDDIEQKRKESKASVRDKEKKPKYINRLLVMAEKRKRENERRIERQVQKERDAEGEEFKDKESFVTSAYRKKLEEFKKMEEEELREEYLEKIGDVTKQGNLDGFYRHLYDQKVNYEDKLSDDDTKIDDKLDEEKVEIVEKKKLNKNRKYRQRKSSESEESEIKNETEEETKKMEHLPSNLDADSDFSIDSSSSEDENVDNKKSKKIKNDSEAKINDKELENDELKDKNDLENDKENVEEVKKNVDEVKEKKPKLDIWKKRTVGVVFDEALQRYFERKSLKESVCC